MMWSTQIERGRSLNRFEENIWIQKVPSFLQLSPFPCPGACLDTSGLSATFYWVFNSYSTPSAFGHEEYSHIQWTEEILSLSPYHFQYSINPSIYAINQHLKNLNISVFMGLCLRLWTSKCFSSDKASSLMPLPHTSFPGCSLQVYFLEAVNSFDFFSPSHFVRPEGWRGLEWKEFPSPAGIKALVKSFTLESRSLS